MAARTTLLNRGAQSSSAPPNTAGQCRLRGVAEVFRRILSGVALGLERAGASDPFGVGDGDDDSCGDGVGDDDDSSGDGEGALDDGDEDVTSTAAIDDGISTGAGFGRQLRVAQGVAPDDSPRFPRPLAPYDSAPSRFVMPEVPVAALRASAEKLLVKGEIEPWGEGGEVGRELTKSRW